MPQMISNINDDLSIVIQMPCFEGHIVIFLVEPIYFYLRFRKHSFFTIRLKFMILIQNLKPLIFFNIFKAKGFNFKSSIFSVKFAFF